MTRFLYRLLIALHPPRFRERFGDEMLCAFDESVPDRTARFFADGILSLLRQWLLRSSLWKMAAGAVISSLLLCAWASSMAGAVNASLRRGAWWHGKIIGNPPFAEPAAPVDEAVFERDAAQAVAILAGIRKEQARKQHSHPRGPRLAPKPPDAIRTTEG
ncbi:MAG TPA: hypothetical protein VHX36_16190 [Candidatus Acidoferrales bacterium]|jgi:hypothetical protein|nr:hypothetical protein [Candidatus Acidoferrales bacterium]